MSTGTGSYWREQKISDYLISGWDGLGLSLTQHLQANEGQAVVEARPQSQIPQSVEVGFVEGVYGAHRILSEGDRATVKVIPTKTN